MVWVKKRSSKCFNGNLFISWRKVKSLLAVGLMMTKTSIVVTFWTTMEFIANKTQFIINTYKEIYRILNRFVQTFALRLPVNGVKVRDMSCNDSFARYPILI